MIPGNVKPPTSFGVPPGTPSAPGAPPYSQSGNIGFTNIPPVSFGMPQPYSSQVLTPYPTQPCHPIPNQYPQYPPPTPETPQMPFMQKSSYSPQMQQSYLNQSTIYPQQQNYNYPNLQTMSDSKECFNTSSPYTFGPNVYSNNSSSYQGGSYPGGQGAGFYSPHKDRSYQAHPAPAPRRNQFAPKVRLNEDIYIYKRLYFLNIKCILFNTSLLKILYMICFLGYSYLLQSYHIMILMPEQMQKF